MSNVEEPDRRRRASRPVGLFKENTAVKRKSKPAAIQLEDVGMSVYDGQEFLGSVIEMGPHAFAAYSSDGKLVDTCRTLLEASRAIHRATEERT